MNIRGKIIITLFVALILHQITPASAQKGRNAGSAKAQAAGEGFWDDRFYAFSVSGGVLAMAVSGGSLYVGGSFDLNGNANNIAKWDGTSWSALGTGMNSSVNALEVNGKDVYAGGDFTTAGGVSANYIAKWDGTSWSALGTGMDKAVDALVVSGTNVYAGGDFTTAGGVTVNYIAKWDGSSWSALGTGMNRTVWALAVSGTDVYAGGAFTTAGGVTVNNIAKWDGSSWSVLGTGMSGGDYFGYGVHALAVSGADVYAGGSFPTAGGVTVNNIAKWDGTSWSAFSSGMNMEPSPRLAVVYSLEVISTVAYAGGGFRSAGGVIVFGIAKWNGSGWSPVGPEGRGLWGFRGTEMQFGFLVSALAAKGTDIYAGGRFDIAGGVTVNNIAKWDGTNWSALGTGMTPALGSAGVGLPVKGAIAASGTDVYAGGIFTTAGGVPANYIAKWDGTSWSALGTGTNGYVRALAVSGTDIFAGGDFTTAGGVSANYIAKWDGSGWSALGTGTNGSVYALVVSGTDVYAGGSFSTAGGVAVGGLAKWDGKSWSALGMGNNGFVSALVVSGTDVYAAGGGFSTARGVVASGIAKWDGTSWLALGTGPNGSVRALAVSGTDLYAGGDFTTAGGVSANRIAKWDGTSWSALGTGMNGGEYLVHVCALAANGADIYCGGQFDMAGDKRSYFFAIWHANLTLTSPIGGEIWEAGTKHAITWLSQPTVGDLKIEYSTDGGGSWMTIAASTPNGGSYDWLVPSLKSANVLVRVSEAAGGDPSDTSAAVFSIVTQPTIVVKSPNGGESWMRGSSHNITWSSTLDVGNVKIEYSTDGGTSYAVIIASTPGTGRFPWTVPNSLSANCLVRISSAAGGTPSDVSDAVFAITLGPVIRLSRAKLTFGATTQGYKTWNQYVILSNAGGGTLSWTATSNRSWLSVSPQSGFGPATIGVSVSASGLSVGKQTGIITVSDPNATNSPQTINVALTIKDSDLVPFGEFSTPLEGATGITGAIPVTGWVLDDVQMIKVEIKRDPDANDPTGAKGPDGLVFIGNAIFVEGARPDIETAYPDYPLNYRAGWGYMLLTNFLPNQGNGTYKLYAYAYDLESYSTESHKVLLGSKTITCSNATAVKPFGTIDTPAQGGDTSGSQYVNFGWVLTPMPKTVPKDGSTIDVYVDSVKVGNLATAPNVYNQYRVDVATAFPGLNNTSGPVGAFYIDTTKYPNGVHTIHWIATDDAGAADGIGSRYFNIMNAGTSGQESTEAQATASGPPSSFETITQVPISNESLAELPVSFNPVWVKRGFDRKRPAEMITPDNYGLYRIELEEVIPIEIDLAGSCNKFPSSSAANSNENPAFMLADPNKALYRGFQLVGTELRPLPIGSTLDPRAGRFSWLPGPGFLGEYSLLFVREEAGFLQTSKIVVEIKPRKYRS